MSRLLGSALIVWLLAACSGLPLNTVAPGIRVADVRIKSLGLFEQRLDVGVRINNPNDLDLKIEALDFRLEVNGRPFGQGLARVTTLIPALSSTVFRIETFLQSRDLIQQIKTLPSDTLQAGVPYRIVGRVKTDRSSRWLPFDYAGVYGGDDTSSQKKAIR